MDKNQKTRKNFRTTKELSYLAGIMDGEGTFNITIRSRGKYHWYQDVIRVHMNDKKVINFLYKTFGGNKYERVEVGKNSYIWQMWVIEARKICKKLLLFLISKRRQAKIMIEMGEIKERSKKFQRDPEHIKNKKAELYAELKSLHQRAYVQKPSFSQK